MNGKNIVSTFGRLPLLRNRTGKQGMSILIGIICPDAIVLAADSQITDLVTGEFAYVDKISVVKFRPNDDVVIVQGGLWSLTNRIVEKIQENAKGVKISKAKDVTQIVEDSIRESKFPLDKEQQDYVNQCSAGLLIAFYVGKKPHLYTVNCYGSGMVERASKHYATMGPGGAVLANYLLDEYLPPKSHSDFAIAASIFAIGKVKQHQKALCGGNTFLKRMHLIPQYQLDCQSIGQSQDISGDFVNLTEKRLLKFNEKTKKTRDREIHEILKKTGSELWQKHIEKVQREEAERLAKLPKNNP